MFGTLLMITCSFNFGMSSLVIDIFSNQSVNAARIIDFKTGKAEFISITNQFVAGTRVSFSGTLQNGESVYVEANTDPLLHGRASTMYKGSRVEMLECIGTSFH